jgi:hypothetical protein
MSSGLAVKMDAKAPTGVLVQGHTNPPLQKIDCVSSSVAVDGPTPIRITALLNVCWLDECVRAIAAGVEETGMSLTACTERVTETVDAAAPVVSEIATENVIGPLLPLQTP